MSEDKAFVNFPLKPWVVPNFATVELPPKPKQDGLHALPSIPLADLPLDALDGLVRQWTKEVYQKAGVKAPQDR